jgi:dihydrodipicolinate synthase/N-acetylneuraminate lyase
MQQPSATGWGGIFPASLTMFDQDGRLDPDAMREHVAALTARGADGIVVGGTTGEFVALTDDERIAAVEAAVRGADGRVPVIAGTGAYATDATVRLTERAAAAGAAGAIVILPYYMRPQRAEIIRFYEEVGEHSSIPVMLYNNPANSAATPLEADDIGRLAAAGAIQAVKSTFPTVHQVHEVLAATRDDFRVFYGSFMAPLEGLAGGAHGWISGILNVVLEDALAMRAAVTRGDLAAAREAWARIYPYKLLYTRGPLGAVGDIPLWRAVLELRGEHGGCSRRPVLDLPKAERLAVGRFLEEAANRAEPVYG